MRVHIALVTVWRPPDGHPVLGVYAPNGAVPSIALSGNAAPDALAREALGHELDLAGQALPELSMPVFEDQTLHQLGFLAEFPGREEIALIYSAGLPGGTEAPPGPGWTQAAEFVDDGLSRLTFAVRDGWRQLAEETTAATELLPPFFTIPELRDVYGAIWGGTGDHNFHRWVRDSNPGMISPVEGTEVAAAEESTARRVMNASRALASEPEVQRGAGATLLAATGRAGTAGLGLLALAVVGGATVALSRRLTAENGSQGRGRPPEYYKRGALHRLPVPYAPRPAWQRPLGDALAEALGGVSNIVLADDNQRCLKVRVQDLSLVDPEALSVLGADPSPQVANDMELRLRRRHGDFLTQLRQLLREPSKVGGRTD